MFVLISELDFTVNGQHNILPNITDNAPQLVLVSFNYPTGFIYIYVDSPYPCIL